MLVQDWVLCYSKAPIRSRKKVVKNKGRFREKKKGVFEREVKERGKTPPKFFVLS